MKLFRNYLLLFVVTLDAYGQEKLGIVNSNYHPVSSIHFNASSIVDSRTYMQLNLVGANIFAMTNAAFLPNFSYINVARTLQVSTPERKDGRLRKFMNVNGVIDGPAFSYCKKNIGFGLFVRARTVADARRIPYQLVELLFNGGAGGVQNQQEIDVRNAKFSNMSWAEYGVNFGAMVLKRRTDLLSVGGNIKYLTGMNLQYLNFKSVNGTYSPFGLMISELEGRYMSSVFGWNSGRGFGIDLGANYKKMLSHVDNYKAHSKSSKCRSVDYKYKIGLSLRDLGYIKFRGNTLQSDLAGSDIFLPSLSGTSREELESNFTTNRVENENVRAFLPAAIAAQMDYNFENSIYLNVSVNKNILLNNMIGVQSVNFISVAPRFETRLLEVAVPLTFQQFIHPQLGCAIRFRSFVLGFDNVVPLVMKRNTSGIGVYFNLAISLFKNPACGPARSIDDCGTYKNPKRKIKRKNSLISPHPRKS